MDVRELSEGLMNHFLNKGRMKEYQEEKERLGRERKALLKQGYKYLGCSKRDDLQNRIHQFVKD